MKKDTIEVQVKTITPIHIGSGNELKGNFEYLHFQNEGVVGVIDPLKIFEIIGEENLNTWVTAVEKQENLLKHLPQLRNVSSRDISSRILNIYDQAPDSDRNAIKEQIHLGLGKPTLPGSSLKGSIRTAILTKLIKDNPSFVQKEENLGLAKRGRLVKYHAGQVEANYLTMGRPDSSKFGDLRQNPNKDLLRFLRVGDAYFDQSTTIVKNKVVNLFRDKWGEKREESSFYECIPSNAIAHTVLQVPEKQIKEYQDKQRVRLEHASLLNPNRLFKLLNKHTLELLNGEIAFWEDEDNPIAIGDYLEHLNQIRELAKDANEQECVIRVGAASGWEFMTGGWLNGKDVMGDFILSDRSWTSLKRGLRKKNYPDDLLFPKTRKMIAEGVPFGFVKLSIG